MFELRKQDIMHKPIFTTYLFQFQHLRSVQTYIRLLDRFNSHLASLIEADGNVELFITWY